MRSSPTLFSNSAVPVNKIKIKVIGSEQNSKFFCSMHAEFEHTTKDKHENHSVSKICEGVQSIYVDKICGGFKELMKEHLEKSNCLVDLHIEIIQQNKEAIVISENSLSHQQLWDHYQTAMTNLSNSTNHLRGP
jgi:hypothetical protein